VTQTILFDLDGTLVDSLPGIAAGTNAVLGTAMSPDDVRPFVGPPLHESFAALTGSTGADLDALVAEYRRVYAELMVDGAVVFDGVAAALKQLSEEGATMAVATSKAQPLAVGLLEGLGLASFFAAVCGPVPPARDDKTATIGDALLALGSPPAESVTMVGDRVHEHRRRPRARPARRRGDVGLRRAGRAARRRRPRLRPHRAGCGATRARMRAAACAAERPSTPT